MKVAALACVVLAALAVVQGRELKQAAYKTVAEALEKTPQLSTLAAAVKASGIKVPDGPVTIIAPTNKAFQDNDVKKATGLSATELLQPKNKAALVALLSYHIIPGAAAKSTQLKAGQQLKTALAGAKPLSVKFDDGKVEIVGDGKRAGDTDSADVKIPDVVAGKAIIHVVDDVLIPAQLRTAQG